MKMISKRNECYAAVIGLHVRNHQNTDARRTITATLSPLLLIGDDRLQLNCLRVRVLLLVARMRSRNNGVNKYTQSSSFFNEALRLSG